MSSLRFNFATDCTESRLICASELSESLELPSLELSDIDDLKENSSSNKNLCLITKKWHDDNYDRNQLFNDRSLKIIP